MCSICKITCKKGDICFCLMCPYMPNDNQCIVCGDDICNSEQCGVQIHFAYVGYCNLCFKTKNVKVHKSTKYQSKLCAFHKSLET